MNDDHKKAFLAEKARLSKLNPGNLEEGVLILTAVPIPHTPRSAKAIITITTGAKLVYFYEIDYHIFTEADFQHVFQHFYRERRYETVFHQSHLPPAAVELIDKTHFRITLGPYRAAHCTGHFAEYPIVSAVFMTDNLVEGIRQWFIMHQMDGDTLTIDSLESFLIKAMPIDTLFRAEVQVKNLSAKAMMFAATVQDHQIVVYGNYILTFERSKT